MKEEPSNETIRAFDEAVDNATYAAIAYFEFLGLPDSGTNQRSELLDSLNEAIALVMQGLAMTKKKIKVPSLPVLARRMEASMRDYQVVFEKEFVDWCMRYVDYFVAIGKAKPGDPYAVWHARACRMARELIESERY